MLRPTALSVVVRVLTPSALVLPRFRAGGGLADTIRLVGAFAGGRVYGDGRWIHDRWLVVLAGAADGATALLQAAFAAGAATSIYGGGGADTINLAAGSGDPDH